MIFFSLGKDEPWMSSARGNRLYCIKSPKDYQIIFTLFSNNYCWCLGNSPKGLVQIWLAIRWIIEVHTMMVIPNLYRVSILIRLTLDHASSWKPNIQMPSIITSTIGAPRPLLMVVSLISTILGFFWIIKELDQLMQWGAIANKCYPKP